MQRKLARLSRFASELFNCKSKSGCRVVGRTTERLELLLAGGTRDRVNKELGLWRERGLIAVEDGMIVICRPDSVKALLAEELG